MLTPMPPSRPVSSRLDRLARFGGWALVLLSVAACTQARRKRDKPATTEASAPAASAPAPEASAPAPAAPVTAAPVTPAPAMPATTTPAPAGAATPRRGLDPARAKGTVRMTLTLPKTLRLGGFSLVATYDADKFAVAEPVTAPAMQGYMCQANLAVPGTIRFNCAGLVNEDRGGLVATFDVAHAGVAPTPADFQVTDFEIVDDLAQKVIGVSPVLAMEPVAPR